QRAEHEGKRGKITITRFKGLGEMNASQLRESTVHPDTRRLVLLTLEDNGRADAMLDMLLNKKRASDRRDWLETKGNLASVVLPGVEGVATETAAADTE
ncbi:MAG TPA: hypothetical protein VD737_08245, partial [Steroidobacteraceae bacterium]|nr:hypothetical protein [Steroidobacteraceae bacterium]